MPVKTTKHHYMLTRKSIMKSDEDEKTLPHVDSGSKLAKQLWKCLLIPL